MATKAEINTAIGVAEGNLQTLQEKLRIVSQSLDNINPAYQANQNYIAKLLAQQVDLQAQIATTQSSVNSLVAERADIERQAPAAPAPTPATPAAPTTPTSTAADNVPTPNTQQTIQQQVEATSAANVPPQNINPVAYDEEGNLMPGFELNEQGDPVFVGAGTPPTVYSPTPVPPTGPAYDDDGNLMPGYTLDENNNPVYVGGGFVEPATATSAEESRTQALVLNAQKQQTLQARQNKPSSADWRVRIQLAPGADYLYKAQGGSSQGREIPGPGILAPLAKTDGVIFPYTPSIETSYLAKYQMADLVHSNYRGYFYQNSYVDAINVRGTFTAQDTSEAQYLLAVIHFFRSVTKMFYGKDQQAGTPPPLVYLSGYGQYQFNNHPCLISSFNYSLPNDVDYIRADGFNNYGLNLENRRQRSSGPALNGALGFLANKLGVNGLFPGGLPQVPNQGAVKASITNTTNTNSTYVPTKMEISVQLLPVQTRSQVSQQFSLKSFANGDLLKGGFW